MDTSGGKKKKPITARRQRELDYARNVFPGIHAKQKKEAAEKEAREAAIAQAQYKVIYAERARKKLQEQQQQQHQQQQQNVRVDLNHILKSITLDFGA